MCGIAGYLGRLPEERNLDRMLAMLVHRGPDEIGTYVDDHAAVGATRLSIVDIASGQQPICDPETGAVVVLNGEVFNHVELREDLRRKGHRFRTESDTEVALRLYLEEGERFAERLNGQFALGIWEPDQEKLTLVRDRFGISPLFYYHDQAGGEFFFASEIKSLLANAQIPRRINAEALDQIFTLWTTVAGHTLIRGVVELEPGCLLVSQKASLRVSRYWSWPFPENQRPVESTFDEAVAGLREQLAASVRLRQRADVEVSAYLSGGIDSSGIVATSRQTSDAPLRTYSIGFEDPTYDETTFQQQVADRYSDDHIHIQCQTVDVDRNFERVIWHSESPLFRTAPSPMNHLSGAVRERGDKVVLTGEGADEILLGYDLFRETKVRKFWSRQPQSTSRPALLKRLYAYLPQFANPRYSAFAIQSFRSQLESDSPFYSHLIRWQNSSANKVFYSGDLRESIGDLDAVHTLSQSLPSEFFDVGDIDRSQYLELTTLLRGYLLSSQGDRMLMSNSVEGRYPYLDHCLVEFANALPQSFKLRGLNDKRILREAMTDRLPAEICKRAKFAYQAPELRAFVGVDGEDSPLVERFLSPQALRNTGLFDEARVQMLLKKARESSLSRLGTRDNMAFVQVLSTQVFFRKFITDNLPVIADNLVNGIRVRKRIYGNHTKDIARK